VWLKYSFILVLNKLARFESNKKTIVDCGVLPHYVRLMQDDCTEAEKKAAVEGLWMFSFIEENRMSIQEQPGCLPGENK